MIALHNSGSAVFVVAYRMCWGLNNNWASSIISIIKVDYYRL